MRTADNAVSLDYHVEGVSSIKLPATVTHEGQEIVADVTALEIDMVSERPHRHGSLTLRFEGAAALAVQGIFRNGADVELTIRRSSADLVEEKAESAEAEVQEPVAGIVEEAPAAA